MSHGGKREGAGRKSGSKNKATLEKQAVLDAYNDRVMLQADALFNAQLQLAIGSMKIFRIDEDASKKKTHVHVTDPGEIKDLLDEHQGGNGVVDGAYYYFADVPPDNKAIEAMLNRALGKAPEKLTVVITPEDADDLILNAAKQHGLPVPETFGGLPVHDE